MSKTLTKGNLIIEEIKMGDIHYEFDYGYCLKSEVISLPVRDPLGLWSWQSKMLSTGETINYAVHENHTHYGPNLYDYEAYCGSKEI